MTNNRGKQLTDDAIDVFVLRLSDYLDKTFPGGDVFGRDPEYEMLSEFVYSQLEDFSNGYRNYN